MIFETMRRKIGTQVELSSLLGVHNSTVNKWEMGLSFPRRPVLKKLATILNCTESEILDAIENSKREQ